MKMELNILWIFLLCLMQRGAHAEYKVVGETTDVDLLKKSPYSQKVHIKNGLRYKVWTFDENSIEPTVFKNLHKVFNKRTRELTLEAAGFSNKQSYSTLFGFYLTYKQLPLLEVNLDIRKRKVILRYQGATSFQRVTLPVEELRDWRLLSFAVNRTHFSVTSGCAVERSVRLNQKVTKIPKRAFLVIGSDKSGGNRFGGSLLKAVLHPRYLQKTELSCFNQVEVGGGYETGYVNDEAVHADRILLLEQQITLLNNLVNKLKAQNVELTAQVGDLQEQCGSEDPCNGECEWGGRVYDQGETWSPDTCTVCVCKNRFPDCLVRTDVPSCQTPCMTSPCQNYGQCVSVNQSSVVADDFLCVCPSPYDGQYCEQKENPCVWPQNPGICDQNLLRYYYDMDLQDCLPFNYTGCGGNVNNYESLEECRALTLIGACCFRSYSIRTEDVLISSQQEVFGCKEISLSECQMTHRQLVGDKRIEVISFFPNITCQTAGCGQRVSAECRIDDRTYKVGERAILGCQECTCERSGQFVCSCVQRAVRKEIRSMSATELAQFQAAIQELRLVGPDNPWDEFRDLYMRHTMHSNGGPYFLPWHRLFLRKLEQKLQQIDCSITLPYFDFSTDVGSFEEAIIWQPNYFGGNGVIDSCVPDHQFGLPGSWRPCIKRNFNTKVKLPSLLELSLALASEDYTEMSMCLESYVSYIHTYIGGDMSTRAAPYDPIFYSIHAYIDMLYWQWQQKPGNKFKYPPAFGNIPMVPFNVPPSAIFDLENDLCVTYLWPGQGSQCNYTSDSDDGDRDRGDVIPEGATDFTGGFNSLGYDAKGYDRREFNKYGYKKNGYNRDGYDVDGYDTDGYSRFGYDRDGYSRYGYDIEGWNKDNMQDLSGRYDAYGYDVECLDIRGYTRAGYDRYGFNSLGYDRERCNIFYKGPFAPLQSRQIWDILLRQPKAFLMSLSRTCPGLEPLPVNWLQQYWITDIKDVSDMVTEDRSSSHVKNSARFCFDIDDFVTPCQCDADIGVCTVNPCQTETCPSYPEASCRLDFCGSCSARWLVNGKYVDCYEKRDFCLPNPCENGGTCQQSIWPSEPQLTTCLCPPGFDGHYCQYTALDVCELPRSTGDCSKQETRWFFDRQTQTCKSFIYTGCRGNANNFRSKGGCEARCRIGACCYRYPKQDGALIGYDLDGYDMYGFDVDDRNRRGDVRLEYTGIKTGTGRFGSSRYDWLGFDRNGYDIAGYDRWGLDKGGYSRDGYNLTGYDQSGEYDGMVDYDKNNYDAEGYNRAGYSCSGSDRSGLNAWGVYTEYTYRCRTATLAQCQGIEDGRTRVIKFSRGQQCDDVACEEQCGCSYNDKTYRFGETFMGGCELCKCTYSGAVECSCSVINRRKEIRDMSKEELKMYQHTIRELNKMELPSKWYTFSQMYADYKAQAVGNSASLLWNRFFLREVERRLQENGECSIRIPYYDWTVNAGDQQRARVWSAEIFGGNGQGINDCVQYHPFKDYYPPSWVPCLRRKFNTDQPLPDTIDIQNALNEPDYDKFRLNMELFLAMFKSWVGGHMDSDRSPYDPLYLSVAAFIDRLFWDWQNKHEGAFLNYPQKLRYIPMMPFRVTPDDVMDSKKQLCVTYFPLSEGGACEITQPNLGYNSMGYDRHGFDREGYDIEGYNVYGVNRNGDQDSRGIYNVYGFDRQGYRRNGYDSMGLDKFGFSEDDYNIDGYDSNGYDKFGYDRYGFDRSGVTPFGFHRNGTLLAYKPPTTFDSYGFNRYGLDRYGQNRSRYDIYGFNTRGYDGNNCNRYFLGPMLILIKRWAELEVDNVDDKTIRIITRICPALQNLPEWRYTVNWLRRDSQLPLIEGIVGRAQERAQGKVPAMRETSVTSEGLWLPLAPDRSLCFVTYYYTECPFGVAPLECSEKLCQDRRCPGFPDAVCRVNRCGGCKHEWYNGLTGNLVPCTGCVDRAGVERLQGTSWASSDCETCSCQEGLVTCVETSCPPVTCSHPVKIPGRCCLQCNDCEYDGILVRDAQTFTPNEAMCNRCTCSEGSVTCAHVDCPNLGTCSSQTTLEGECCPTCLDCGDRQNGDSWRETACQQCTCVFGSVECERIQCIPPDCSHPRVPPGECCATCDDCRVDGRDLMEDQSYMQDQCTQCLCRDGNVRCDPTPCPRSTCLNPITPPGECCPRCDNACQYLGRVYQHSQSFESPEDRCMTCTCDNTVVRCVPVACLRMDLPCQRPITLPGQCCPTQCPTCFAEGREYETGERWTSLLDPCETCLCDEGVPSCTRQDRCPRECQHGITMPGQCCSDCTDCIYLGLSVRDGQTFVRPGDNCQQCMCNGGEVTCRSLGPCPRLPCRVTETPPGACCAQCVTCSYEGRGYRHGDVVFSDDCSTCTCMDGEVDCERVQCPAVSCRAPVSVPGECCPVCRQCDYRGRSYEDGERFTPFREPCLQCVCEGGEVNCTSRENECPLSRCTHPLRSYTECCPSCNGCTYLRKRFRNGQKFVPPGNDNCKVCRCFAGSVECSTMGCPPVNCDNAVLVKGQCCPVCPMGCNVMGIEYRDGQTFNDFMDRCQVCTCMMGQIRCMAMMSCSPVTCTHPANRPGNCCPSCTMCELNSVQYRNGEVFTSPHSVCQECTCRDGSITCERKRVLCAEVNCLDPVLDPDTCCPRCQAQTCMYAGRQYGQGQVVPASRNACEECSCVGGMIDCARKECLPVTCRNPGREACCETCQFCEYNSMRFELGELFPSPADACEDCVCQAGSVECLRRVCAIPNCSNPTYMPGECCPVCLDCTYQGLQFSEGEDFYNPSRPCERCNCMSGKVACDDRMCP
ncbi:uncharacterized protein LOC128238671 [Mya arenaria]|uniref:uncharacterized protein LOC128238671 n=1 Tax=Mya arenaria TaxID=6604 RepID=UPI0022DFEEF9|nr:uncharacterized protein LOC128238671 [Mya arenaria]